MFACKSEKPFKRDFNCGTLLRRSAGIACNSPVAGFAYLSNAINAGLPSALLTTFAGNSAVSTPLSQIAMLTGLPPLSAGTVVSRAAQMSGLSTLCAARYVPYVLTSVSLSGRIATIR